MKKAIVVLAVLAAAGVAQADLLTIWEDDFQGPDLSAYTQLYPSYPVLLDTGKGYNSTQSIHFGTPAANSQVRMYANIGDWDVMSDDMPIKLEFMMDIDTEVWSTRQYIELRDYTEGAYGAGGLAELVAIGFTSSGVNTSKVNARIMNGPNWFDLNADKTVASDWAKMTVLFKTTSIEFYVNDVLDTVQPVGAGRTWDSIVIGSGLSSAGADVWFDNLKLSIVPEPATLAFLAIGGGLFLRRRRA